MSNLKTYDYTQDELNDFAYSTISTNKGDIKIKLYNDEVPNTVANFASLANDGFYDDLIFHRVIPGFMAQGGCPNSKDGAFGMPGTGGPGWAIECETDAPKQIHKRGTLSMAHAGKNTGGSQFFICFVDCPHLDGVHTTFGRIEIKDRDSYKVLDEIAMGDKIEKIEIFEKRD